MINVYFQHKEKGQHHTSQHLYNCNDQEGLGVHFGLYLLDHLHAGKHDKCKTDHKAKDHPKMGYQPVLLPGIK